MCVSARKPWITLEIFAHFALCASELPCILILIKGRFEDVPLTEFMHLVFTRMPGESYRR